MVEIKSIDHFIEQYRRGQRNFVGLEFENGECFSGLEIMGSTFRNCWFCADFSNSNLTDCKFIDSNIKTTNFSQANLTRAEIKGCLIEGSVFDGATITDIVFEDNSVFSVTLSLMDFKQIYGFDK